MSSRITAITTYCPKVVLQRTVGLPELVAYLSSRTGLNKGEIQLVLSELSAAVQFYAKQGQGVKLPDLGTYLPTIDTHGRLRASYRVDRAINNSLNAPGAFTGTIANKEHIGKTADQFIALWNADHPDDPVSP